MAFQLKPPAELNVWREEFGMRLFVTATGVPTVVLAPPQLEPVKYSYVTVPTA